MTGATMTALDDAYAKALESWRELEESSIPVFRVGAATCGRAAKADKVLARLRDDIATRGIEARILEVGCMGLCFLEPLVIVNKPGSPGVCYGGVDPKRAGAILERFVVGDDPCAEWALGKLGPGELDGIGLLEEHPILQLQVRNILRNCGLIDPEDLDHYLARDGYRGFQRALEIGSDATLEMVKASGLRGRGGAGFSTGQKWEFCRNSPGLPRYLICNADEGDPGAFMNRSLLEGDPHAVLEGMLIAGYTLGASESYVYCRAEYPLALQRLDIALGQMRELGLLGEDILGSGFSFDITVKKGAGAFVCGEETALIASIEGHRGMPRPRPPFPAVSGLWGKPTIIQNVETLGNLPNILRHDADWYKQWGSEGNSGTKTFALAGNVKNTGLIEVPLGMPLIQLVEQVGGGVPGGKKLKAVQTGGPSGGCIPAEKLDLPVDYESLAKVGSIMGSGGLIVLDEDSCSVDIARYFLSFTQEESCGKCAPCRVGTRAMLGILEAITAGKGTKEHLERLERLARTIKDGSLCGLGQTAPNPVLTTLRYFREEYEEHIEEKKCRAFVCQSLLELHIDEERCIGCEACKATCPTDGISGERDEMHVINQDVCTQCGMCLQVCPPKYAAVYRISGDLTHYEQQVKKKSQRAGVAR
jgi:NADH:ubiquinone oxidoreductase subunit F (NADH-binding)/NAD-dependent dihydropyrimidine dehydrogenase PreA subunit/(2Fe-2S) ferredoxin